MAHTWIKCLFFVSVWYLSEINCYNIQRIDNENGQLDNAEIDFYSSFDRRKFFLVDSRKADNNDETYQRQTTKPPADNDSTPLDSWSVVWYVASFGGLIIFFLIVSCSEWCCRRAIRNQNCNRTNTVPTVPAIPDTPPPSYDQFAPPSYESICLGRQERGSEKSEYDIYVVPVHALGTIMERRETEDAPPSYYSTAVPDVTRFESVT